MGLFSLLSSLLSPLSSLLSPLSSPLLSPLLSPPLPPPRPRRLLCSPPPHACHTRGQAPPPPKRTGFWGALGLDEPALGPAQLQAARRAALSRLHHPAALLLSRDAEARECAEMCGECRLPREGGGP